MVHNVLAIDAVTVAGKQWRFGPMAQATGEYGELVRKLLNLYEQEKAEIEARFPKLLRKVAGYNLDHLGPPHANAAHLLVGSEGTLAYSERILLKLSKLPEKRSLGVCHFKTFYRAMEVTQHIVKLGPTAVELVDRTMIGLAREIPAFEKTVNAFIQGDPDAILLVEFADERAGRLKDLVQLMADLGLPGSVVEITDARLQREVWEVRKAGLNIMMSMKGDGKPVSFIEDCAVPLEHLAEYTSRLSAVFEKHGTRGTWYAHASVGTLHVRPVLDMRRDGANARHRRRSVRDGEAVQGRVLRRARRRPGALRMDRAVLRAAAHRGAGRNQVLARPEGADESRQDRAAVEDGRPESLPLQAGLRDARAAAGARLERVGWLRQGSRDVQQQRPLPQVRHRHDVPVVSRDDG
jgi:FAD/FMN-containing dehydrogenase